MTELPAPARFDDGPREPRVPLVEPRDAELNVWRCYFVRSARLLGIGIVLGAVGAGIAIGFTLLPPLPTFTDAVLANIEAHLDSMDASALMEALGTQGPFADALRSPWTLFLHNLTVAAALVAGGVSVGVLTRLILIVNGVAVGFLGVLALVIRLPPGVLLASVVPHGLFEVTGVCLAGAAGLRLGDAILRRWRNQQVGGTGRGWLIVAAAITALMLVAAFLELYVTPGAVRLALKLR